MTEPTEEVKYCRQPSGALNSFVILIRNFPPQKRKKVLGM
jgi:hypothetical protein